MKKSFLKIVLVSLGMLLPIASCKKGNSSSSSPTTNQPNQSGNTNTSIDTPKTDSQDSDSGESDSKDTSLNQYKEAKKSEVDSYKDLSRYRDAEKTVLTNLISKAKSDIDNATSESAIDAIVSKFKADADNLKTDEAYRQEEAETGLNKIKEDSKNVVDTYKDLSDYRDAEKTTLTNLINQAKSDIDNATSEAVIEDIIFKFKEDADKIKTDADYKKEEDDSKTAELLRKKEAAKNDVDSYKVLTDYRDAEQTDLIALRSKAKSDIDAAVSEDEINQIVSKFKEDADKIKTAAKYQQEEDEARLAKKKEDEKQIIDTYKNLSDYRTTEQNELTNLIKQAKTDIDNATSEAAIDNIVSKFKVDADKIKTDAMYKEEEALLSLEQIKTLYEGKINNYNANVEYDTDEASALQNLKNTYLSQIASLTETTVSSASTIYDEFVTNANNIETKLQKQLRIKKENVLQQITVLENTITEYFTSDQADLQTAIQTAKDSLNTATTIEECEAIISESGNLKSIFNGKTKVASYKTSKTDEINSYKTTDINKLESENQTVASAKKTSAISALDSATSQSDMDSIVQNLKDEIDALIIEDNDLKVLKAYKSTKIAELDNIKPDGFDLIETELASNISDKKTNAISSINQAQTTEEIDNLVSAYEDQIKELILNKRIQIAISDATNFIDTYQLDAINAMTYQSDKDDIDGKRTTGKALLQATDIDLTTIDNIKNTYKDDVDQIIEQYNNSQQLRSNPSDSLDQIAQSINGFSSYIKNGTTVINQEYLNLVNEKKQAALSSITSATSVTAVVAAKDAFENDIKEIINEMETKKVKIESLEIKTENGMPYLVATGKYLISCSSRIDLVEMLDSGAVKGSVFGTSVTGNAGEDLEIKFDLSTLLTATETSGGTFLKKWCTVQVVSSTNLDDSTLPMSKLNLLADGSVNYDSQQIVRLNGNSYKFAKLSIGGKNTIQVFYNIDNIIYATVFGQVDGIDCLSIEGDVTSEDYYNKVFAVDFEQVHAFSTGNKFTTEKYYANINASGHFKVDVPLDDFRRGFDCWGHYYIFDDMTSTTNLLGSTHNLLIVESDTSYATLATAVGINGYKLTNAIKYTNSIGCTYYCGYYSDSIIIYAQDESTAAYTKKWTGFDLREENNHVYFIIKGTYTGDIDRIVVSFDFEHSATWENNSANNPTKPSSLPRRIYKDQHAEVTATAGEFEVKIDAEVNAVSDRNSMLIPHFGIGARYDATGWSADKLSTNTITKNGYTYSLSIGQVLGANNWGKNVPCLKIVPVTSA